jgi:hypothetical protein
MPKGSVMSMLTIIPSMNGILGSIRNVVAIRNIRYQKAQKRVLYFIVRSFLYYTTIHKN